MATNFDGSTGARRVTSDRANTAPVGVDAASNGDPVSGVRCSPSTTPHRSSLVDVRRNRAYLVTTATVFHPGAGRPGVCSSQFPHIRLKRGSHRRRSLVGMETRRTLL